MLALPSLEAAHVVGLFAATGDEPATAHLHALLASRGLTLAYPRVMVDALVFAAVADLSELRPGYRGIAEPPPDAAPVPLDQIDLLLVPGLGFAPDGARLGQGGGHYDRLLAKPGLRALTVGLCFAVQLVPNLPREPHDRPVDRVVTERDVIVSLANRDEAV